MSLAELVITSVKIEGRSKSEVARDYRVSRYWVQLLVRRYEADGPVAFQPRSRRPDRNSRAVPADLEDRIVRLRKELSKKGLDAGAETIRVHLHRDSTLTRIPSTSTIWRILTRRGFVTPQPKKRPKGAGTRFCADMPNERWQADITHWQLADSTGVEILNIEDDHSRLDLRSDARLTTSGDDVLTSFPSFRRAFRQHGIPARVLTDSQAWCRLHRQTTPRRSRRPRDRARPARREVRPLPALPSADLRQGRAPPQTQKKWLTAQPPAQTLDDLQRQLDRFRRYYNTVRPHRAIGRRTPAEAYTARPKAKPAKPIVNVHDRVRRDRIDGCIFGLFGAPQGHRPSARPALNVSAALVAGLRRGSAVLAAVEYLIRSMDRESFLGSPTTDVVARARCAGLGL
jgi:transposase InsO family protein